MEPRPGKTPAGADQAREPVKGNELSVQTKEVFRTHFDHSWSTVEMLQGIPSASVEVRMVERDSVEPPEAYAIRKKDWAQKIEERKAAIVRDNPDAKVSAVPGKYADFPDLVEDVEGPDGRPAQRKHMNNGPRLNVANSGPRMENGKLIIPVYEIGYAEEMAFGNADYLKAYKDSGKPLPYSGIGVMVLLETKDGMVPWTVRSAGTPAYPKSYFTIGGGPKPGQTSGEAIAEEIAEETGLSEEEGQFDTKKLKPIALVQADKFLGKKNPETGEVIGLPHLDVVYRLPVDITFEQLAAIRNKKVGKGEPDVWDMEPRLANPYTVSEAILRQGYQMVPGFEAGLFHFMIDKMADSLGLETAVEYAKKQINEINDHNRPPFHPPERRQK